MLGGPSAEQMKLRRRKRGIKLCILVSESNSCRPAYRFLKAFLLPSLDELHLVTAINAESGRASALSRQRELIEADAMSCARHHVVVKEEDFTLFETLGRYIASVVQPHLIFMGSIKLCTGSTPGSNKLLASGRTGGAASSGGASAAVQQPRRMSTMSGRSSQPGTAAGGGGGLSSSSSLTSSVTVVSSSSSGAPNGMGMLGTSCLALRVLPELRCAPVVLAKYNSKGPWLSAMSAAPLTSSVSGLPALMSLPSMPRTLFPSSRPSSAAVSRSSSMAGHGGEGSGGGSSMGWPMRVMVDLQPNSRHVLDWLFEHFTPGHDHLFLTVSQAFDEHHRVKPAAQRLLTAFGVQATVNSFEADKTILAGPVNKSLPQAVMESEPDVLVLQTPRCRGLPPSIVELLYSAKTSFLIWPPDYVPPVA